MKYILADTGFWIALLDGSDELDKQAVAREIFSVIKSSNIQILFPSIIFTELLRTKFFKTDKKNKIKYLEDILKLDIIYKIDEKDYIDKELALKTTLQEGMQCKKISFADNILRLLAKNFQNDIQGFLTFDQCLIEECQEFVKVPDKCLKIAYIHRRDC
jgi:predicted nucleic acid-binding protein